MTTEPNDGTWELQDEMRCPVCNIVGGQHTLQCRNRSAGDTWTILTDLIADLRGEHKQSPVGTCAICTQYWPCDTADFVTVAEVRLAQL